MAFSLSSWLFRSRVHAEVQLSGRPVQAHRVVNPFHAVSIVPGPKCCEEARKLEGIRFLSQEAPKLPLAGCICTACACRYAHHDDRRQGSDRRRRDVWSPAVAVQANEQRRSKARRFTDH